MACTSHGKDPYRYGQGPDFNGKDPGTFDKSREDMNEDGLKPDFDGDIEFKNVYFEYEKGHPFSIMYRLK